MRYLEDLPTSSRNNILKECRFETTSSPDRAMEYEVIFIFKYKVLCSKRISGSIIEFKTTNISGRNVLFMSFPLGAGGRITCSYILFSNYNTLELIQVAARTIADLDKNIINNTLVSGQAGAKAPRPKSDNSAIVIIVVISFLASIIILIAKSRGRAVLDTNIEERKKEEKKEKYIEQQKTEKKAEEKRMIEEANSRYDHFINCSYCKGTGKIVIMREWRKENDDGYMEYMIANPARFKLFMEDPEEERRRYPNDVWDHDFRDTECLYCKGEGTALAWFEKQEAHTSQCQNCKGTGKAIKRVKLDVGMGNIEAVCDSCKGEGKINHPETSIVHFKTVARLKSKGEQYSGWGEDIPETEEVVINDQNREFYSKSKPRFS